MDKIKVVGVYTIQPTMESIVEAVHYYKYDFLLDEAGNYEDRIYWENHEDLTLVEIKNEGVLEFDLINTISQSDQAAYMEYFLDSTGTELLPKSEFKQAKNARACFFLHFTDFQKPLKVGELALRLPAVTPLPERLVRFTHYLPVG